MRKWTALSVCCISFLVGACKAERASQPVDVPSVLPREAEAVAAEPEHEGSAERASPPAVISPAQPPKGIRARELHPLSPDNDHCLEMYSVCSGTPPLCTSAPFYLPCGQQQAMPGTSDWVRCVCAR